MIRVSLTQVIGWGTSFSMIAVLGTPIGQSMGVARELVFAGITVMLLVSAALSPYCGRIIDRDGPRLLMACGSLVAAVGLALMAASRGAVSFWAGWALLGVSLPMALTNAAVPAVVQSSGRHARRAVTVLTIIGGLTSAMFLPLTAWLEARYGWRGTLSIYAGLQAFVAFPIHVLALPGTAPVRRSGTASPDAPWDGILPADARRRAFVLIATWSCLEGLIVWGFNMQALDMLRGLGLSAEVAIGIWMLAGPSQAAARVGEFLMAGRYPIMATALISASLAPIGFTILVFFGTGVTTASLMALCYGAGHGLFAVARNLLPLRLFGLREFGVTMGRLTVPQNLANGVAPILSAALLSRVGAEAAVYFTLVCALASFVAVVALSRDVKRADARARDLAAT
jgi:MFS family permease